MLRQGFSVRQRVCCAAIRTLWHIACINHRHKRCVTTTSWSRQSHREKEMPYLIGWLLGVPLIVLVILYLIFH
ncbi:conserved hypothetical protein [Paraburkholderia caribensis]|nr:conserved hypothetical protein [Paraburkholderia caribensis]